MPTLRETEFAVAQAIISSDCSGVAELIADARISAEEALAIYRGTFVGAATKALRLAYPAVDRLTGAEFFEGAAAEFISSCPPNSGCLDDYGARFAEFLAGFPAVAALPYLADVARLEWAVNKALRANDVAALDADDLLRASAMDPAKLVLRPHPSVALLRLDSPADVIWRAVLAEDEHALASISMDGGPLFLVIARDEEGVSVERLPPSDWDFLSLLCRGKIFAEAFGAVRGGDIPALLAQCFARGRFIGFEEKGP